MKMRKSTWLLLVLALAAILLVAGCSPTTPPNGEEPNGEEPPPTPPPTDKECPEVVKTEVSKLFDPEDDANFQIVITFNEDFDSSCIENPAFWTITVANPGRLHPTITLPAGNIDEITVDGKVVTVKAWVGEVGPVPDPTYEFVEFATDYTDLGDAIAAANALIEMVDGLSGADLLVFYLEVGDGDIAAGETAWETFVAATIDAAEDLALAAYNAAFTEFGFTVEITQGEAPVFDGLICNQDDADKYEELFGREIKFADEVSWKLTNCAVYDELGNVCCDYEGEDCCVEPYCEECPEPEEGCDLTEPGACL